MQIHHRHTEKVRKWVHDDDRGPVMEVRERMSPSTEASISVPPGAFKSTPNGATFSVRPDNSFIVPEDVGRHMVDSPGDWYEGPSPFAMDEHDFVERPLFPVLTPDGGPDPFDQDSHFVDAG